MNESAGLQDQLLATKFFIPSSSHALILRRRLLTLLMKSLECPLTLLSAPPGFGKTTLLSHWIPSLPPERARVAWVSVDEGDNEPTLFWRYVLTALDRALLGLCAEPYGSQRSATAPGSSVATGAGSSVRNGRQAKRACRKRLNWASTSSIPRRLTALAWPSVCSVKLSGPT